MTPALKLDNLSVAYRQGRRWQTALREVSLEVAPGETYGIVGESGSGKSTLALAVMRYLGENGRVTQGSIALAGRDLLTLTPRELREVWRHEVKLVPQNPLVSLNPSQRIGRQLEESVAAGQTRARARVLELLASVGLADPERAADRYPHQLSGGQQQRVMIAMALASEPSLLVMDEPTTNLDVTTERAILQLVRELVRERDTAVLYVSHSLGVIAQLCDRVAVLYAGELVEDAPVEALFTKPLHPYTRGLLDSVPTLGQDRARTPLRPIVGSLPKESERAEGCVFAPRCPLATDLTRKVRPQLQRVDETRQVRCHRWEAIAAGEIDPSQPLQAEPATAKAQATATEAVVLELKGVAKHYPLGRSLGDWLARRPPKRVQALARVGLSLRRQRTLGLVGESGSGKSTLARCVVGLSEADSGELVLFGAALPHTLNARDTTTLRRLQMVFQNADEALNPYRTVGSILRRPLTRLGKLKGKQADARVGELLRAVKLDPSYASRLPAELSGGEKQRVAIARAFATEPDLILFDESVSGLDVSVQAAILNLLQELQHERDSAYLFISHDLAVVSYLADEVAVMYLGQLMEVGETHAVLQPPYHPYTEALLAAVPELSPQQHKPEVLLEGELPSPVDVPQGCPFYTRCPRVLGDLCRTQAPPWQVDERGKRLYCHIPLDELARAQTQGVD
jgi:peptide/nickel transport system ATP-binding protein